MGQNTLDPDDWGAFRASAHKLLDAAMDKMESAKEGRVWTPLPEGMKEALQADLPVDGLDHESLQQRLAELLPYGVGNTHPRFFGWVHGAGNPGSVLAEITSAAMNANLGGRDHGAIYVEKQVIEWSRKMMGFPEEASGLLVSGTSMATIIACKVARDSRLGSQCREQGVGKTQLVGYLSEQAHSCIARAFDLLGIGSGALRKIPCNADFSMNLEELQKAIKEDRAQGFEPFFVVGTAGSVNVGAIDDLDALAEIAKAENLWLHVDGAFGATAILSKTAKERLVGLNRADSVAFDFHKWLQVNYDAGCVLIRSKEKHLQSFSGRAEYLTGVNKGLAAGDLWPVDLGPELSRGFRALKVWAHLLEHGVEKLGACIDENCRQAAYLGQKVEDSAQFELLAPVALNIVCFRYIAKAECDLDALNKDIVIALQERGIAAPSTTFLNGQLAIRVNITNHRTDIRDLDLLLEEVQKIGAEFTEKN
ncbi:pyridoxal phosphate-dependent decarboxylase family protein [Halodesulfovibrio spirochaetisodalis]|uniref:Cytochrome D ubiquinol oxidase subunit I n=1 Tax=Halodesulfovibrio spirochaetisodalis TaxID=1560234 RepID=A0A1B7X9E3_9BACT|nr:aminotransferase class I/II-fold pyridoxal phosphate-dependent enzyme [Halodesulfovibrio spirochaetisodalis]OBQ46003.1 cytochrome D ubiquinol oxidase subunit I [Halodesulfovibrio spirochaetisodalis]